MNHPSQRDFISALKSTMKFTSTILRIGQDDGFNKPFFGRSELQIMLDDDMDRPDLVMEVAEQQHLVWVLGCICGVRPSSLGHIDGAKDRYPRWKHVDIRREASENGQFDGRFTVTLLFRYLKGRNDDPAVPNRFGQLRLTLTSARSPENIPFSIPHRLLTILLRRGLLKDYSSVEELFDGGLSNISIKPDALEQPMLFAVKARGFGLTDRPMRADSFSPYMSMVARRCGLGHGTMYAWRNKAGTEVARAAGADKARYFLNHKSDDTFEKHYDQGEYDLDVTAINIGEDHVAGAARMRDDSRPALYRATIPISGSAIERDFVESFVVRDNELSQMTRAGDVEGAYWRRKRLRRQASKAWVQYHEKLSRDTLTLEQVQAHRRELGSSSRLMSKVRESMRTDADEEEWQGLSDDPQDDVDLEDQLDIDMSGDDNATADGDSEAGVGPSPDRDDSFTSALERTVQVDSSDDIPFRAQAKAFMEYLLEDRGHPSDKSRCSLCEADDTASEKSKNALYSKSALIRHQRGSSTPHSLCSAVARRSANSVMEHISVRIPNAVWNTADSML